MIRNGLIFEKHGGAGPSNGIHWMRLNFRGMISGFDIMNINSIILGMFISESHEYLRRILEVLAGLFSMTLVEPIEPIPPGSWRVQKRRAPRSPHSTAVCHAKSKVISHQLWGSSLGMEDKGCTPSHGQTIAHHPSSSHMTIQVSFPQPRHSKIFGKHDLYKLTTTVSRTVALQCLFQCVSVSLLQPCEVLLAQIQMPSCGRHPITLSRKPLSLH